MSTTLDDDSSFSDDNNSNASSDGGGGVDYLPISPDDDGDDELSDAEDGAGSLATHSNGDWMDVIGHSRHLNSNPHLEMNGGVSSLDLNGGGGGVGGGGGGGGEEEQEEQEREREREASIRRAFSEDERRRTAPLTRENAVRVMEAMRGVSLRGFSPDWAGEVPEERWVGQLRRLRGGES